MKSTKKLLEGKICLVTGAGRGIGRKIAETFYEEGAIVYCNATTLESLRWVQERQTNTLIPLPFDVGDSDQCRLAILTIKTERKEIDVLVNNAGVEFNERIGLLDRHHRDQMFKVNVFGPLELIQLCARLMQRQKKGSIINIASMVGIYGNPGQLVYSATKGAVIAMTKSAAKELASYDIRVNAVAPGLTDTDMLTTTDSKFLEYRLKNIGMGRLAKPQDIANTCLFLASDLSTYLTGQVIEVDGSTVM